MSTLNSNNSYPKPDKIDKIHKAGAFLLMTMPQHGYIISLLPICILFLFTKSLLTSRTYFAGNLE
jgi:hypothetical protein